MVSTIPRTNLKFSVTLILSSADALNLVQSTICCLVKSQSRMHFKNNLCLLLSVCKPLGSEITGNIKTPYFPNQYPLNVLCTWPIPAKNHTMLYLSANTIQFGARHSLVLKGVCLLFHCFNPFPNYKF